MPFLLADDINTLILQFLRDSGFLHSAFTFSYEAGIEPSRNSSHEISLKLVDLLQKGVYFKELESIIERICDDDKLSTTVDQFWRKVREAVKSSYSHTQVNHQINMDFDFYSNGRRKLDYLDLSTEDVFQVPQVFGRVNDICWGSDYDLVTAHETGACVCWIIEKSNVTSLSLKMAHLIEPKSNVERFEVVKVDHIV
ncbi:hypothetical protein RF11_05542 [Thelohanellus kitauei]|uniref:Uncharacterized protein n=1 Tax=Thelohanellus kitauei TaxID=669202 RepID=A0A0C2N2P7_THEKT|nr:hypothetical protein RF11_05542 [Thelohanellus kitauei]